MHISNRSIADDRRNWLCAERKADGERAASIHSFIETRKADDVDPQAYIADFTARIAGKPKLTLRSPKPPDGDLQATLTLRARSGSHSSI